MRLFAIIVSLFAVANFAACQEHAVRDTAMAKDSLYTYREPSEEGSGKIYRGREISYIMGAAGAEWLERNTRDREENTKLAIAKMNLTHDERVADIGAGTGYYTFAIAQHVPQGKVYAVEIQDEMLGYLNRRKTSSHTQNVAVIKGSETSPNLPDTSIDLAIMVDVYHELAYPHEMLQAIKKALKPTGKLLLLEYKAEDPTVDIKTLHKMTIEQANKELEANGFTLYYDGEFLPMQHFLLYKKQ